MRDRLLNDLHVGRLQALVSLHRFELDLVILLQRLEARALNGGVMNEDILASVARRDEPEPLRTVKPLYRTFHNERSSNSTTERNRVETNRCFHEYPEAPPCTKTPMRIRVAL